MNFGEYIKSLRIAQRLTLRKCCADVDVDPSYWSKIERNITPPPKDISTLNGWADFLKCDDKQKFFDLASIARCEIPMDIASDEKVIAALPVFFRAVRGQELKGEVLNQFIEDLREVYSSNSSMNRNTIYVSKH